MLSLPLIIIAHRQSPIIYLTFDLYKYFVPSPVERPRISFSPLPQLLVTRNECKFPPIEINFIYCHIIFLEKKSSEYLITFHTKGSSKSKSAVKHPRKILSLSHSASFRSFQYLFFSHYFCQSLHLNYL